jgi:hypothetical protein
MAHTRILVQDVEHPRTSIFEWLPCSVACDTACERGTYFEPCDDDDNSCSVHLRGRLLKGDVSRYN